MLLKASRLDILLAELARKLIITAPIVFPNQRPNIIQTIKKPHIPRRASSSILPDRDLAAIETVVTTAAPNELFMVQKARVDPACPAQQLGLIYADIFALWGIAA